MGSPFPGMDPYLERHWGDVHQRLISYACDQLESGLPKDLVVRMKERVYVESEFADDRPIRPDIHVAEESGGGTAVATASEIAVAEPVVIRLADEPMTEGFIEIRDATGGKLVTVIELLSPANKRPGDGQDQYRQKQREVLAAGASLVEIDLTRSGRHVLALPEERIPARHRTTYRVCVHRGWRPLEYELYPILVRERLPAIRVPLRKTDPDVALDLQPLVDRCYGKGRYDRLDYRVPPDPPLDEADAAWADELLRTKGLR